MGKLLDVIEKPEDVKDLDDGQLEELAREIRMFLIENVSKTGGHLASNLGVVELTLALHRVLNSPADRIVWDVGHQSYVHKIITGRKSSFHTLRKRNGLSGFPKTSESSYDCFNTGHSSTSISAALGMAKARDINREKNRIFCVIGDGALTGGMAFEALNDAGRSSTDITVILNDNEMSISRNVGGISKYLNRIRTEPIYFKAKEDLDIILKKIPAIGKSAAKALDLAKGTIKYIVTPGIVFEELGFKYLGPIDGHNIEELVSVLSRSKKLKGPVFIHVFTQKGKGYEFAEKSPHTYHGIPPFQKETGELKKGKSTGYSQVFGHELIKCAASDERVAAVTAAMPDGTGLSGFQRRYPERFFDVGIAEQHAVTFAAGLAASGMKPVVAIYSSFLQRAYDQILHDVSLQNLGVVFAIDRAGIAGEDGETHQGLYDISYLVHMPNMTVMAPCDYREFRDMIRYAVLRHKGPITIRYPRGCGPDDLGCTLPVVSSTGALMAEGKDITIAAFGSVAESALNAARILKKKGIYAEVINARFAKPLDRHMIVKSITKTGRLVTVEENVKTGGFGCMVMQMLCEEGIVVPFKILGLSDKPLQHGTRAELLRDQRLDELSLSEDIDRFLQAGGGAVKKKA